MTVYKTTNMINGKIYVGKHIFKTSIENDFYLGSGGLLKRAIIKYGEENFKRDILEICNSIEHLNEREKFWISELNSCDLKIGYNIAPGGDGGDLISNHPNKDDVRKFQAERTREIGIPKAVETKRKNGTLNLFGSENPNFGNKWNREQKEHASKIKKEKYQSGYIHPQKGIPLSAEAKRKISNAMNGKYLGKNNPFFEKQHTDDTKTIISKKAKERGYVGSQEKPVNIDGVIYRSISEASKKLLIPAPTILWRIRSSNPKFSNYKYDK